MYVVGQVGLSCVDSIRFYLIHEVQLSWLLNLSVLVMSDVVHC